VSIKNTSNSHSKGDLHEEEPSEDEEKSFRRIRKVIFDKSLFELDYLYMFSGASQYGMRLSPEQFRKLSSSEMDTTTIVAEILQSEDERLSQLIELWNIRAWISCSDPIDINNEKFLEKECIQSTEKPLEATYMPLTAL